MRKRGRVVRNPTAGPGLLMAEGQQYQFVLEGMWQSEAPPKSGLVVDIELDGSGRVQAITIVPDSQLRKEQEELATTRQKDRALASSIVPRFGVSSLVAGGLLAVAWFFLPVASIQVPVPGTVELTFWQVLGFLNTTKALEPLDRSGTPSPGIYGAIAVIALAAPFLHHFWKDKRAWLGGLLPLIVMVIVGIAARGSIARWFGVNEGPYVDTARQAREAVKAVSLGIGSYVSILASLYLAFKSAEHFRSSKVREAPGLDPTQRKAA